MCDRAVFIHDGRIASEGSPRKVCDDYERQVFGGDKAVETSELAGPQNAVTASAHFDQTLVSDCEQRYGNGEADIEACWLEDALGNKVNVAAAGDTLFWCYRVRFHQSIEKPVYAMMLKTTEGTAVFGTDTSTLGEGVEACTDNETLLIRFQFTTHLAPGNYFLNAGLRRDSVEGSVFMSRRVDAAVLRIVSGDGSSAAVGPAELHAQWAAQPLDR